MLCRAAGVAIGVMLAFVGSGWARPATPTQVPPHVTMFGDSVAEAVLDDAAAHAIVAKGFDIRFEIAPCRRIADLSCPINGVRPPNVMDVLNQIGTDVGPNVVVAVGYNDYADQYAKEIDDAATLMEHLGAKRIFWLTLHVGHADYQGMNDAIVMAAANHKSLIPVDWNTYSQPHPEWFQGDGIHLNSAGAGGMATLIHTSLARVLLTPPKKTGRPLHVLTKALPQAHVGKRYGVRLAAVGGRKPYVWTLPKRLPRGLSLRAAGWIGGIPRARAGSYPIVLRVRDASGASLTVRFTLRIRR